MDVEARQADGRHGRLWFVTIDPGNNGTIRVKVAGDDPTDLRGNLWGNRVVGKKMDPPLASLFLDYDQMLEHITAIEPAPGRYTLRSPKWTRYVVWVYCCQKQVEVVAVSERQMKMTLWHNWGGHLDETPSDRVSWNNFNPEILSEEPAVEARRSVRLIPSPPPPKPEPLDFSGIFCPLCGQLYETTAQKCRDCGALLRKDARSSLRVPRQRRPTSSPEPLLIGL